MAQRPAAVTPPNTTPILPQVSAEAALPEAAHHGAGHKLVAPYLALAAAAKKCGLTLDDDGLHLTTPRDPHAPPVKLADVCELAFGSRAESYCRIIAEANPGVEALRAEHLGAVTLTPATRLSLHMSQRFLELRAAAIKIALDHAAQVKREAEGAAFASEAYLTRPQARALEDYAQKLRREETELAPLRATAAIRALLAHCEEDAEQKLARGDAEGFVAAFKSVEDAITQSAHQGLAPHERQAFTWRVALTRITTLLRSAKSLAEHHQLEHARAILKCALLDVDRLAALPDVDERTKSQLRGYHAVICAQAARVTFGENPLLRGYVAHAKAPGALELAANERARLARDIHARFDEAIAEAEGVGMAALGRDLAIEKEVTLAHLAAATHDSESEAEHRFSAFAAALGVPRTALAALCEKRADDLLGEPAGLDAALAKLAPDVRPHACELLLEYAECAVTIAGRGEALRAVRDALRKALADGGGVAEARLACFEGKLAIQFAAPAQAVGCYARAIAAAKAAGGEGAKAIIDEAALAQAGALSQLATAGGPEVSDARAEAARALRALRTSFDGGAFALGSEQLARIMLLECNAELAAGLAEDADQTLRDLARYQDDPPWVGRALRALEGDFRQAGALAALKVLLAEANGEPLPLALAGSVGGAAVGAAVGAAIGVWVLGVGALPCAAAGALIGGLWGTGAAKIYHLVTSGALRRASEAYRTGLARQTWGETLYNTALLSVDVIANLAPFKGAGALGKSGFKLLARLPLGAAERDMLGALLKRVERAAEREIGACALPEAEALARELLVHTFNNEAARFGGKVMTAATLATIAAPFAVALVEIETSGALDAEKKRARAGLCEEFIKASLALGVSFAPLHVLKGLAAHPGSGPHALRRRLNAYAPSLLRVSAVEDLDRAAQIDHTLGAVALNRQVLAEPDDVVLKVIHHEVVHANFWARADRDALAAAFTERPEWPALRKRFLELNPGKEGVGDLAIVDELLAEGLSGSAPRELALLMEPALSDPRVRGAAIGELPRVDVGALRAKGTAFIGDRPYLASSEAPELSSYPRFKAQPVTTYTTIAREELHLGEWVLDPEGRVRKLGALREVTTADGRLCTIADLATHADANVVERASVHADLLRPAPDGAHALPRSWLGQPHPFFTTENGVLKPGMGVIDGNGERFYLREIRPRYNDAESPRQVALLSVEKKGVPPFIEVDVEAIFPATSGTMKSLTLPDGTYFFQSERAELAGGAKVEIVGFERHVPWLRPARITALVMQDGHRRSVALNEIAAPKIVSFLRTPAGQIIRRGDAVIRPPQRLMLVNNIETSLDAEGHTQVTVNLSSTLADDDTTTFRAVPLETYQAWRDAERRARPGAPAALSGFYDNQRVHFLGLGRGEEVIFKNFDATAGKVDLAIWNDNGTSRQVQMLVADFLALRPARVGDFVAAREIGTRASGRISAISPDGTLTLALTGGGEMQIAAADARPAPLFSPGDRVSFDGREWIVAAGGTDPGMVRLEGVDRAPGPLVDALILAHDNLFVGGDVTIVHSLERGRITSIGPDFVIVRVPDAQSLTGRERRFARADVQRGQNGQWEITRLYAPSRPPPRPMFTDPPIAAGPFAPDDWCAINDPQPEDRGAWRVVGTVWQTKDLPASAPVIDLTEAPARAPRWLVIERAQGADPPERRWVREEHVRPAPANPQMQGPQAPPSSDPAFDREPITAPGHKLAPAAGRAPLSQEAHAFLLRAEITWPCTRAQVEQAFDVLRRADPPLSPEELDLMSRGHRDLLERLPR